MMFANSRITDISEPFNEITLDFSACNRFDSFCTWSDIMKVPKILIGNIANNYVSAFKNAWKLKTIVELAFPSSSPLLGEGAVGMIFYNCPALENITVTGTIMNTGFDLHWSTKLTVESLTSILTALSKDSTAAAGKAITFPTAAQEKINGNTTAKGQYDAALAAGWTIAFA